MIENLKDKTVLVMDYGLFESTAVHLAKDFGKVLYYVPWKGAYPGSNKLLIGEGLDEITRVRDFFDHVPEADLIFFPDLGDGDLQVHLRAHGKRVWGTGKGENLENFRWRTKELMKKLGMPTSPCKKITGIDALRRELVERDGEKVWVKVSTMRADLETRSSEKYILSKPWIDDLQHRMGAKGPYMEFIVENDLPDAQEEGYDGWCIDGEFPSLAMLGYEIKGSGLVGRVMPYGQLPKTVRDVNSALAPTMKEYEYRGSWSSEIRDGILIDPCCRQPSPPSELYPEMYENFSECVWAGANGEIVEPIQKFKYGVEICIESDWSEKNWMPIYFPESVAPFVKLRNFTKFGDTYHVLPMNEGPRVGAVIGVADTLLEACVQAMLNAKAVEGFHIEADTEAVGKGLKTVSDAQEKGVQFVDEGETIPTDEEVSAAVEKASS